MLELLTSSFRKKRNQLLMQNINVFKLNSISDRENIFEIYFYKHVLAVSILRKLRKRKTKLIIHIKQEINMIRWYDLWYKGS